MTLVPLVLSAVLASNASGKTLVRTNPGTIVPISGSSLLASFPFSTPGCYASGSAMGTKGETITVSRAGNATYADASGTIQTCSANQARVGCDPTNLSACGLLVEPARTNYVLNSATQPKTAEATASLPTGDAVAWHAGTGTMTIANGTATTTGLSCTTVAAGTVCSFTVTGAGTMLVTTTSGTTHAQVENGTFRTSQIATAGTAGARAEDAISIVNPLTAKNPASWCIDGTYTPGSGRAWGIVGTVVGNRTFFSTYSGVLNNSMHAFDGNVAYGTTGHVLDTTSGTGANLHGIAAQSLVAGSTHRIGFSLGAGVIGIMRDGAALAVTLTGPGTGPTTQLTPMWLGSNSGANSFSGYISNFKISKGVCK